jgi:hypothetical protein
VVTVNGGSNVNIEVGGATRGTFTTSGLAVVGNVSASTFNSLAIMAATGPGANQIIRSDGNAYTYFGWINSVSGNHTSTITRITASNDQFLRYVTPAHFRSQVVDSNAYTLTGLSVNKWGGSSWDTASILINGSGSATFTLHPGTYAPQLRAGTGANTVYFRNSADTGWCTVEAIIVNQSNPDYKQDIVPYEESHLEDPLELIKKINTYFYRYKKESLMRKALPERREQALVRLNGYRRSKGLEDFQTDELVHVCGRDCRFTPEDPCEFVQDWENGWLGVMADEVGQVAPHLASLDAHTGKFEGVDGLGIATLALTACKRLLERVEILEGKK